jgi:LPXTG-site transpeptidase (sortase) family protein
MNKEGIEPKSRIVFKLTRASVLIGLVLVIALTFNIQVVSAAGTQVPLDTAIGFAVLAGSGITNTGATTITGDVGTFPTISETGFGSVTLTGTNHYGDAVTQTAKTDLTAAYINAAGQGQDFSIVADLGTMSPLIPGVYKSDSSIGLTGTVVLDGGGDPNAVFIFQAGSTLTTASNSKVVLINGAQPCNVFWQVGSSATLGTGSTFFGTIMALTSITDNGGSTIDGRFLARNGAVTLNNTTIARSICQAAITTTLSSNSINAGDTIHDSTTLVGVTNDAGGTVSYEYYSDTTCTGSSTTVGSVAVTNGIVPDSSNVTFPTAGMFYWQASYSGDTNNYDATSACVSETLVVNDISNSNPILTTELSSSSISVGDSMHDTASFPSGFTTGESVDNGSVIYTYYMDIACTLDAVAAGTVTIPSTTGNVPDSNSVTFDTAGTYYWRAVFTGDDNNNGAISACNEVLTVNKISPTIAITLSATSAPVGTAVYANAVLSGATINAIGSVTYSIYTNSAYTGTPIVAGIESVASGVVPDSNSITFDTPGTYYWQVVYSGDANNNGATGITNGILTITSTVNTPAVLPQTGFAPAVKSFLPAQPVDKAYASLGDLWLEIPRLDAQMPIVGVPPTSTGWDVSWLSNQVGWLQGTAFPTWAGNSVLTAHVYNVNGDPGPFGKLDTLRYGDRIIVHGWGQQYLYEIRSISVVTPDAVESVIRHEELPWVTLMTCKGYDEEINSYKNRYIVRAIQVEID